MDDADLYSTMVGSKRKREDEHANVPPPARRDTLTPLVLFSVKDGKLNMVYDNSNGMFTISSPLLFPITLDFISVEALRAVLCRLKMNQPPVFCFCMENHMESDSVFVWRCRNVKCHFDKDLYDDLLSTLAVGISNFRRARVDDCDFVTMYSRSVNIGALPYIHYENQTEDLLDMATNMGKFWISFPMSGAICMDNDTFILLCNMFKIGASEGFSCCETDTFRLERYAKTTNVMQLRRTSCCSHQAVKMPFTCFFTVSAMNDLLAAMNYYSENLIHTVPMDFMTVVS
ncbi:MAG: hypothetical protein JSS82_12485 [Bacteroidetes bacterium]|nr:hypothetical protein [Bacteroidota bacterium]